MSRHEVSENLIERSLQIQEKIDQAEKCIDSMDIKGLLDLGMIDRRVYQSWERAEQNEQDLVNTHGDSFEPSFRHYYIAMERADKNINRLQKEVDNLIGKSRATLRQASRHEVSENLIERSLQIQEKIDQAEKCVEAMDIKGLFDLGMINRRDYQSWERAEQNEQDLVDTHGDAFEPSFRHYYGAMEKADKNINRLQKEVDDLIGKSRATMRQASRLASAYMSNTASKTAASGNYGHTKSVQNDVEVALRKLQKKVDQLARVVESKHPEAGTYFSTRCQGSNCNASKALSGACLLNQKPKRTLSGPLGFKPNCARASHKAITDLILYSGEVAHGLHKKSRNHVPYLESHSKEKHCPLTRLLLENYPVEIL